MINRYCGKIQTKLLSGRGVLRAPISVDGKLLKISVLGNCALRLLQHIVASWEVTTRCIVSTYRNQPAESDGRFSGISVEHAQLLGSRQQRRHRRRLPACPPAGCALGHRFQPDADRLERTAGIRALDGGGGRGPALSRAGTHRELRPSRGARDDLGSSDAPRARGR